MPRIETAFLYDLSRIFEIFFSFGNKNRLTEQVSSRHGIYLRKVRYTLSAIKKENAFVHFEKVSECMVCVCFVSLLGQVFVAVKK